MTRSVPACRGWSPRSLRGAALEFACWVAQRRQIGVIVSPRGPKLEQLPRQGPLRCCLPSRSHLKPPLAKPPPDQYANYHQHGRHHGSDRSRSHSVAPLTSGRPGWDTVALDGLAPARAKPDRRLHPVTPPHLAVNLSSPQHRTCSTTTSLTPRGAVRDPRPQPRLVAPVVSGPESMGADCRRLLPAQAQAPGDYGEWRWYWS